jgi:hypothetical protein
MHLVSAVPLRRRTPFAATGRPRCGGDPERAVVADRRCHDAKVTDRSDPGERVTDHVEMSLPLSAIEVHEALDEALHQSDRHIGVITGGRDDGLYLGILTEADTADAARERALQLVAAALRRLSRDDLSPAGSSM